MATPEVIFLPNRTTAQKNAISPVANGMILYDSDFNIPFFYNGGTAAWDPLIFDLQSGYNFGGGSLAISGGNHFELSGTTAAFRFTQMTSVEFAALDSKSAGLITWETDVNRLVCYNGTSDSIIPFNMQDNYDFSLFPLNISGGKHFAFSGTTAAVGLTQMTAAQFGALGSKTAGLISWDTTNSRLIQYDGTSDKNIPLDLQDGYDFGDGIVSVSPGKQLTVISSTPGAAEFIVRDSSNPMMTFEYTAQTFVPGESNGTLSFYALDTLLNNIQSGRVKSYINDFTSTTLSGRLDLSVRESVANMETYIRLNDNDNLRVELLKRTNVNNTGVSSTDNSAIFEVISTNRVSIPAPKMTTAEFTGIGSKTEGSMAWSTDDNRFKVWDGTVTKEIAWTDDAVGVAQYINFSFRAPPAVGSSAFPTAINIPYAAKTEGDWTKITGMSLVASSGASFATFASDTITMAATAPAGDYMIDINCTVQADVAGERIMLISYGINVDDTDKALAVLDPVCVGTEGSSSQWRNVSGSCHLTLSPNDTVKIFISQISEPGAAVNDMDIAIIDGTIRNL